MQHILIRKFLIFSLLALIFGFFQSCGNVAVTEAPPEDQSSGGPGGSGLPVDDGGLPAAEKCVRKTQFLVNLIDMQIPAGKVLYNNYFTQSLALGEDILVLADYSFGNLLAGGTVTGATGVVEAKYVSSSGSMSIVGLPVISGYSWNSQAGTAPAWCYIAQAVSDQTENAYILFHCTSQNTSPGFNSYIFNFKKTTKGFTQVATSNRVISSLTISKNKELLYLQTTLSGTPAVVGYQVHKIAGGTDSTVGAEFFAMTTLFGYTPNYSQLIETDSGEILIFVRRAANESAVYNVTKATFKALTFSRDPRAILQSYDSRKIFYYSFDYGPGVNNSLFTVGAADFAESKQSDDNRYIYFYQALNKKVVTKIGSEYGVVQGKAWISYDEGQNFDEVILPPLQSNQVVQSPTNKFNLVAVDAYSNGHIKASIYKLVCN